MNDGRSESPALRPVWIALAVLLIAVGYVAAVTWPLPMILVSGPETLDLGVTPAQSDATAALDGWVALQEQDPSKDVVFSDAELSVLFSEGGPFDLPFSDAQVRLADGDHVTLAAQLAGTGPASSVFAEGRVELVEGRWLTCRLDSVRVDGIEVPDRYLEMAESYLADWANAELTRLGADSIDVLRIDDGSATLSRRGDGSGGR